MPTLDFGKSNWLQSFLCQNIDHSIWKILLHFQQRMSDILCGLEGVVCLVDDVLVFGETQTEHDKHLLQGLRRLEKAGLTLNREKCQFNRKSIKFLGQVVDEMGVQPDSDKISAIKCMSPQTNYDDSQEWPTK